MAGRLVLIFIDGLGVGLSDPAVNPCASEGVRFLNNFTDRDRSEPVPFGGLFMAIDAAMGVPGLPQSATGQTALLTGLNAPKLAGRHKEGFPNKVLRKALLEHSILKVLAERGLKPRFINAYRPRFFDLDRDTKLRLSATTVANLAANLPFSTLEDVRNRKAIYQEFTNRSLIARGFDVPPFAPGEAGEILAGQARFYDFTFFEYFQTDKAGHSRNMDHGRAEIYKIEEFLESFLSSSDLAEITVLLCGEHGNIEDMSVKPHTNNPAMGLAWGIKREYFADRIRSLTDVVPAIKSHFFESPLGGDTP
ncbi:hypothetical protein ACFLU6_02335 [Acidobacteriota bacterium]